jgi:D-alanyl-D-alanine carboxypeptidase
MLTTYEGADGLKTGYTEAAGHNLVTSAVRGDTRLIGVVLAATLVLDLLKAPLLARIRPEQAHATARVHR